MSDPYAGICYRRNFLKEVVLRVDLLSPLPGVDVALPPPLTEAAISKFPIPEPRDAFTKEVMMDTKGDVTTREERFKEWRFHGKERTKTLSVGPKVVFVQYKAYQNFELVKSEFIAILEKVAESFRDVQISRLGVRYINEIKISDGNPIDWSLYIAPQLLSLFEFPLESDRMALSRVFHNLELSFDDFNLRYLLGMPNPDYPARIRQKIFIQDFDAYSQSIIDIRDVGRYIDSFHSSIQHYFEHSITDKLREIMNAT